MQERVSNLVLPERVVDGRTEKLHMSGRLLRSMLGTMADP